MKITSLSEGRGYHFPPCQIIDISGFRILLDCPLDLSAISAFSPITAHLGRKKVEPFDSSPCINAVPWYKTINALHLFDPSFINVVLISTAMGMLGLPFLTRDKRFSGEVYATELTMKLGQLMMNDLVSMHSEFRRVCGPENSDWMRWEELERISSLFEEMVIGKDGSGLGGWLPLYTKSDVKSCIRRVQPLRYNEETCYNGALVMKPVSSGLEIGASNWTIDTPKLNVAYVSSSVVGSSQAMDFDYRSHQGYDAVIYSDVASFHNVDTETVLESEKLAFILSCAFDSILSGGSVLVPISRLSVILQFLELVSTHEGLLKLDVPVFMVSSVSEEMLSLMNVIPEWLSETKQDKMFAGEPLFAHVSLLKENRLRLVNDVFSSKLVELWREPCIVLCPYGSLRLGPAVHFLDRWKGDENSLLVLEKNMESDRVLCPFKPMKMKVLECEFVSGIKSDMIVPLMEKLRPKVALFPESLAKLALPSNRDSFSTLYYAENDTLRVPKLKNSSELEISEDLDSVLEGEKFKDYDATVARLRGDLLMYNGKQRLIRARTDESKG